MFTDLHPRPNFDDLSKGERSHRAALQLTGFTKRPAAEQAYFDLSTALLHRGDLETDGHYWFINTPNHGTVKVTSYMSFEHKGYRYERPDTRKPSLDRILAGGSPIISVEVPATNESFLAIDPRFVKEASYIKRHFLTMAAASLKAQGIQHPPLSEEPVVFLRVADNAVQVIDPYSTPVIQEVLAARTPVTTPQ